MSQRKIIREKFKSLLIDKTVCGQNVFENRLMRWRDEKLPAISIYTQNESVEIHNVSPRVYKRKLNVAVEIVAFADDAIDDFMDSIADGVEGILHTSWDLDGVAENLIFTGTQIGVAHDGDKPYACARLEYEVHYSSTHGVSREDLPDLLEISNKITSGENEIVSNIDLTPPSEE